MDRDIIVRFFQLTFSQKHEIAKRLGLYKKEDVNLSDFIRFKQVLLRAARLSLDQELAHAISLMKREK